MSKKYSILCIDDEENILHSYKRLLRYEDYNIFEALCGKNGIEILKNEKIDLILCDQKMPSMSGFEVLRIAKNEYPEAMRIMVSGYSDFESLVKTINEGEVFRFISKPWDGEELKNIIKTALKQKNDIGEIKSILLNFQKVEQFIKNISFEINQNQTAINIKIIPINKSYNIENITNILNYIFKKLGLDSVKNIISNSIIKEKNSIKFEIDLLNGLKLIIEIEVKNNNWLEFLQNKEINNL